LAFGTNATVSDTTNFGIEEWWKKW
jgi:hypothetical protein